MAWRRVVLSFMAVVVCFIASAQIEWGGKKYHWNKGRGYEPFRYVTSDAIILSNSTMLPKDDGFSLPEPATSFNLRFCAANIHNHPAKSYACADAAGATKKIKNPAWCFYVKGEKGDSLIFTVKTEEQHDVFSSEPVLSVSARTPFSDETVVKIKEGVECHTGKNNWVMSAKDEVVTLSVGNRSIKTVLTVPYSLGKVREFGFIAYPGAEIEVRDITFSDNSPERNIRHTSWSNPDHLKNYLSASSDPLEGYWTVFDRTLEETLLQLGGDYRLAMVREGEEYLLIYISGARVGSSRWKQGDVKARLLPDPFPDTYGVVWYDSEGLPLSNSIKAQSGDGETLTIQFPYQSSSLRLRKIPDVRADFGD